MHFQYNGDRRNYEKRGFVATRLQEPYNIKNYFVAFAKANGLTKSHDITVLCIVPSFYWFYFYPIDTNVKKSFIKIFYNKKTCVNYILSFCNCIEIYPKITVQTYLL